MAFQPKSVNNQATTTDFIPKKGYRAMIMTDNKTIIIGTIHGNPDTTRLKDVLNALGHQEGHFIAVTEATVYANIEQEVPYSEVKGKPLFVVETFLLDYTKILGIRPLSEG